MSDRYTVERIMEIIAWVVGAFSQGTPINKVDTSELSRKGYTDSEISAALSWILERGEGTLTDRDDLDTGSFRILHGLEWETISSEAWGLLLSYHNLGLLSNEDVEQIIERAMILSGEASVDLEEIRAIIAVYVMNLGFDTTSGSRSLLSGNESIN
jgi:uncharacterized protein Smg (DUF494 family)